MWLPVYYHNKIELDHAAFYKHNNQYKMANFVYNFILYTDTSIVVPDWILKKDNLKLILWAGDGFHDGQSDIARLPNYDIYLCKGYPYTIQANFADLEARPADRPGCICIIDTEDQEMMRKFVDIFKGRFALIDSDYYGNTPTLKPHYYEELLAVNGKAFHIEGINGLRYPQYELQDAMEIFAPILPEEVAVKRQWTTEMIELAKGNNLDVHQTWGSRDMVGPYYDPIRERQAHYLNGQKARHPYLQIARSVDPDKLEEYWTTLPIDTLTVNLQTAWSWESTDGSSIEPYKQRFADHLEKTLLGAGYEIAIVNDFKRYIALNSQTLDFKICALQNVLKTVSSAVKLLQYDTLHFTVGFYRDVRRAKEEIIKYGLSIQKLYASK
jgi:hypothetical protein